MVDRKILEELGFTQSMHVGELWTYTLWKDIGIDVNFCVRFGEVKVASDVYLDGDCETNQSFFRKFIDAVKQAAVKDYADSFDPPRDW